MEVTPSSAVLPLSAVAAVPQPITTPIHLQASVALVVALQAAVAEMVARLEREQLGKEILVALRAAPGSLAVAVVPAVLARIILERVARCFNTRLLALRSILLEVAADRATPELAVTVALVVVVVVQ